MLCCLPKQKKYKQDFNDPWNFLLHAPPWHSSNPPPHCWDILLQGIVFIKCFILMQTDEKHPVSRIVYSQLTPHQICCTAVVAKQKIQVFVLFDYFGEFIVPCRGKWLLKGVPKMLSKTTWNLVWVLVSHISQIFQSNIPQNHRTIHSPWLFLSSSHQTLKFLWKLDSVS